MLGPLIVMLVELYQMQCKNFVRCNTHLQLSFTAFCAEQDGFGHGGAAFAMIGNGGGIAMRMRALRYGAVALACLLAAACKGRQEPVKPIASAPIVCFIDY
jgi:hypothetical protein